MLVLGPFQFLGMLAAIALPVIWVSLKLLLEKVAGVDLGWGKSLLVAFIVWVIVLLVIGMVTYAYLWMLAQAVAGAIAGIFESMFG